MGFTTRLFRRGWQHPDPDKRKAAIRDLDDLDLLKKVACDDADVGVRRVALGRIPDWNFLLSRMSAESNEGLLAMIVDLVHDDACLTTIARNQNLSAPIRQKAIMRISDQETLECIAMQDCAKQIRIAATRKVNRPKCLEYISTNDRSPEVREAATDRLNNSYNAGTRAIQRSRQT